MGLFSQQKQEIIKKFGSTPSDTGASSVQVALLTERLTQLNKHFEVNPKDHHSRRGLLKLVGQRRKLLDYMSANQPEAYRKLIAELGIRR